MGYNLKKVREESGMTQQELADKSGVNRVTIALIESGKTKDVKASTIVRLAEALGKSTDDIFFNQTV